MSTSLLLIDEQKDFHPGGSLEIPTATEDAVKVAKMIRENASNIQRIYATLDSHSKLHIAHGAFWVDASSGTNHPDPFTIITSKDIEENKWMPSPELKFDVSDPNLIDPNIFPTPASLKDYCLQYTRALEDKGRFALCIWPEHCLVGHNGHAIVDELWLPLQEWSTGNNIQWLQKGQHPLTEMYSACAAEVPLTTSTSLNVNWMDELLKNTDRLVVAGQAMSHCVNYTLRDLVDRWQTIGKPCELLLVTDGCSAVPGFDAAADEFQKDMALAGVKLVTADQVFSK